MFLCQLQQGPHQVERLMYPLVMTRPSHRQTGRLP